MASAISGVQSIWASITGGSDRKCLPSDSVVIKDRKRSGNKLGDGSFAKVYRGEYNGKPCAVKVFKEDVLRKELTPEDMLKKKDSIEAYSEAEMLLRVRHENIVQIYGTWYDHYKDKAAPSIVMELCDESLYNFIRRDKGKTASNMQKLHVLQNICRGMVYLHGKNIIHGDLRSNNVLLCYSEAPTVVKLADFGMARLLDPNTNQHFTTRFTDEQYLPPEVFEQKTYEDPKKKWARLTPKVDVFCFGELVLEMGCGRYPAPSGMVHASGQEMLTELKRRETYIADMKQYDKETLGAIVQKCLSNAPESRPYFTEILQDVDGYLLNIDRRPDLEKLQNKTAECEELRAQISKLEDVVKMLSVMQDKVDHVPSVIEKGVQHTPSVAESAVQHTPSISLKVMMESKELLLRYHLLATFSPSNYLHSDSGHLVVAKKKLERVCDTDTIQPACIGDLKAALDALPTALEKFAHTDFQGVVCLAIPYATFTDEVRLCRMCFCHTPAGFDDKGRLHPKTVVAIAHVVLKPSTSSKLKACAEGLVYSPTWYCGRSEELQSCFTERKLLPELVPVLQQLELATTFDVKRNLCESLGILNLEREFDADKHGSIVNNSPEQLVPRIPEMTSMQVLLELHVLATFSPPNYLHSETGQLVVERKRLERVCDTTTISVHIGSLKSKNIELPTGLEEFAHMMIEVGSTDHQGVVCLVIPYVTFSDKVRLCRMCVCHTPAGCNAEKHLHPETVVAIASVVLKPGNKCGQKLKSQACTKGLVYSPTWYCGCSEELQACFTERKLLPELVPVLQQLELATTIEVKKKLCEILRKPIASLEQDFKRKVFYDKSSKQSEQTAEENQRLLAKNNELKEKVQEMVQASLAQQEKITEKQKFLDELIDEQQREIAVLKKELSPLQEMKVVPSLASDVFEQTGDEVVLQQLCYMATGIEQLLISPDGGTFTLGNGDASLKFPPGAVQKDIHVRYAIILHGPFVLPAGYKPGSVIIYLNMEGATLVKPVQLFLSHWCIREEADDEATMKFIRAPHSLESGKKQYAFEELEDEADFTTRINMGILTIREPHCLLCVETKEAKIGRYIATTFTRNIPSDIALLFRIQLMCDSLEWNKKLATALEQSGWQKIISGIVQRFSYLSAEKPIAASIARMQGPGWTATIEGQHAVKETYFLMPKEKSESEMEEEVIIGLFPPCVCAKILFTSPEERRVTPALLRVDLLNADVPLTFSCTFKEEPTPTSPGSSWVMSAHQSPTHTLQTTAESSVPTPTTPGPSQSAVTPPSSPQADALLCKPADMIKALNHQLDAQWWEFGTFLYVDRAIMEMIRQNKSDVSACMLQLVEKWLYSDSGTGHRPRTWETVVQAVKDAGNGQLAEQLAKRFGVQLSGH